MSTLLRGLARPRVSQPLRSIRTVTTQVPAAPPQEGGRPPSSDVAPLPDMAVTAEVVSGAPGRSPLPCHRELTLYMGFSSGTSSPRRAHLPSNAEYDAKRGRQGRKVAHRLGCASRRRSMAEPLDGLGQLVSHAN